MSITREWKKLHEARKIMRNMRKDMRELDGLMIKAQREICQPKNA